MKLLLLFAALLSGCKTITAWHCEHINMYYSKCVPWEEGKAFRDSLILVPGKDEP